MGYLVSAGHDENGRYHGGRAGDQTGTEFQIRAWYNPGWDCIIRFNEKARKEIAEVSKKAAKNNHIGYDQYERQTYFNALKAAKWNPSKITKNVETDCSASTSAAIIAAGYLTKQAKLKKLNPNNTTSTLRSACKSAGATIYTDYDHTHGKGLMNGDIVLREGHHVVVYVSNKATSETNPQTKTGEYDMPLIKKGCKGKAVQIWQIIIGVKDDGIFGENTERATKIFQTRYGLESDGIVGENSWKTGLESV